MRTKKTVTASASTSAGNSGQVELVPSSRREQALARYRNGDTAQLGASSNAAPSASTSEAQNPTDLGLSSLGQSSTPTLPALHPTPPTPIATAFNAANLTKTAVERSNASDLADVSPSSV
jgi:hypothetical protein